MTAAVVLRALALAVYAGVLVGLSVTVGQAWSPVTGWAVALIGVVVAALPWWLRELDNRSQVRARLDADAARTNSRPTPAPPP